MLRRARIQARSVLRDPLEVAAEIVAASAIVSGLAVGVLMLFQLFLHWLEGWAGSWLASVFGQFDIPASLLPSPRDWLARGPDYVADHWQLVVGAINATFVVALMLGHFLGTQRGKSAVYAEELLRQQQLLSAARSRAVVRLKSGAMYSGFFWSLRRRVR